MNTILTLDLGTKTGWAMQYPDGSIKSGTWDLKGSRYQGGGMRFLNFNKYLDAAAAVNLIKCIYFEEVRAHAGVDAAHIYGGFLAILTSWCEAKSIPYMGVSVGTIKKFATGKGNASKQEVIAALREMGFNPKDDNEADAIAILGYVTKKEG